MNWCVSELDTYDAAWACLGDSDDNMGPSWSNLIEEQLDFVTGDSEWGNGQDEYAQNSRRIVHVDGLGAYFGGSASDHEVPTGWVYETVGGQAIHNPNCGVYVFGAEVQEDGDIYWRNSRVYGSGGYGSNWHMSCNSPVAFFPITIKAGHKYLMYNADNTVFYDEDDDAGMGGEFYIGSPHHNANSAELAAGVSGCSKSQANNAFCNPTFVAGWFGGCRAGWDNTWGDDSYDKGIISPRIFTAPSNPNAIPCAWDMPGPGLTPLHESGAVIWPQALDEESYHGMYHVSPRLNHWELHERQQEHINITGGGMGMSTSYQRLALDLSLAHYYENDEYVNPLLGIEQGPIGGGMLPFGYKYETCVVAVMYTNGDFNDFGEGHCWFQLPDIFEGFGMIDMTEILDDDGWDIEQEILDNLGNSCTDTAFNTIGSNNPLSGNRGRTRILKPGGGTY
jgi:hypothetical protein